MDERSVVLLHGLGSHPDTAWSAKVDLDHVSGNPTETNRLVCWVTDFLPQDIPIDMRPNIRLFFYNYDTYYMRDAVHTTIENAAQNFLGHLNSVRQTDTVSPLKLMARDSSPSHSRLRLIEANLFRSAAVV
jgi:hypothetical protein